MRLTTFQNIHQLTFSPLTTSVNCYIVEEENSLTLIDAALPSSCAKIIETAKQIGKPITYISFTHPHFDHVGDAAALKQTYPEAKMLLSLRDAPLFAGDTSLLPGEPNTPVKGGTPKNFPLPANGCITEGDSLGSLKVIALAGHTPGSIGFLDTRTGTLLTGDAMQTKGGLAIAGQFKPLFPFIAFATWSFAAAVKSVESAVFKHTINAIAPGHGPVQTVDKNQLVTLLDQAKATLK